MTTPAGFLKCDFHCHTTRSDGRNTPEEMVAEYEKQNFDIVAITDHNVLTIARSSRLLLIRGTEWSVEDGNPRLGRLRHILMLGLFTMPRSVADAVARPFVVNYVAHPATWLHAPGTFPAGMDGVESVNAKYAIIGGFPGQALIIREQIRWNVLGWRQIGCSDAHSVGEIGSVYTLLRATRSWASIRAALRSPRHDDRRIIINWSRLR
ncbi:MAG: hypothetical protein DDT32_01299 [Syntrophomonadaceae bacterium]|nr:hypothetical protein [Bacillota bacterium]MBT9147541.1 hypothetical protein [Bacillota bacterium]